jgi:hypothetical protein
MKKFLKGSMLIALASFFMVSFIASPTAHAAGPGAINLGTAGNFVVLTKTGISVTGSTNIVGDIGVSPISATAITGFSLNLPVNSTYATSPLVSGKIYAPGYANPTPSILSTAVNDMQNAYTNGAGRTNPTATELGAGNIGGLNIAPGLYKWGTGVTIPSNVTLTGSANDIWIFQIAQTLTVSSGVRVSLAGGAQASNIYWIVGGQTTIGTTAEINGTILGQTAIVLATGARLNGRALAQTAVTLDSNQVTIPSGVTPVVSIPTPVVVQVSVSTPTPTVQLTSVSTPTIYTGGQVLPDLSGTRTQVYQGGQTVPTIYSGGQIMPSLQTSYSGGQTVPDLSNGSYAAPTYTTYPTYNLGVQSINSSLSVGSRVADVTILQQFLIEQSKGPASRALAQNGTTQYFGSLTRAALAEFQGVVGISPAIGNFGPITRYFLSS